MESLVSKEEGSHKVGGRTGHSRGGALLARGRALGLNVKCALKRKCRCGVTEGRKAGKNRVRGLEPVAHVSDNRKAQRVGRQWSHRTKWQENRWKKMGCGPEMVLYGERVKDNSTSLEAGIKKNRGGRAEKGRSPKVEDEWPAQG